VKNYYFQNYAASYSATSPFRAFMPSMLAILLASEIHRVSLVTFPFCKHIGFYVGYWCKLGSREAIFLH
jgi:hypothetical protein